MIGFLIRETRGYSLNSIDASKANADLMRNVAITSTSNFFLRQLKFLPVQPQFSNSFLLFITNTDILSRQAWQSTQLFSTIFVASTVMPQRFKWDPFTGIMEALPEEPKPTVQIPPQITADYADAESKTKAFLDTVHAKEKRYLEAYEKMHGVVQNARTPESRQIAERHFDVGHQNTVKYRDEEVRNRDTAINNLWSVFAEKWPGTTCKLVTAAEQMSGKTSRTVEIESPYIAKRDIGPITVPEARYLVDETKGEFRALARQPQGFLPQGYGGGAPTGFGHPPSASHPGLDRDLSYADYDRIRRVDFQCNRHVYEHKIT